MPVYVARHHTQDVAKIGFSEGPIQRIYELIFGGRVGEFRFVAIYRGDRALERTLHERFSQHRLPRMMGPELFKFTAIQNSLPGCGDWARRFIAREIHSVFALRRAISIFGGRDALDAYVSPYPIKAAAYAHGIQLPRARRVRPHQAAMKTGGSEHAAG